MGLTADSVRRMRPEASNVVEAGWELPARSEGWIRGFGWYGRRLLHRSFHKVRVSGAERAFQEGPVIAYANHASWWDPVAALTVGRLLFPDRATYAPIEAAMLRKYPMFGRMGFFGVEKGTRKGAAEFLRAGLGIMHVRDALLMITPQGRFADVRERPVRFEPGLGHLAVRCRSGVLIPMAMEYAFWEEKRPEILLRLGRPVKVTDFVSKQLSAADWTELLEWRLEEAQNELRDLSVQRAANRFDVLFSGLDRIHPVYDLWRRARAWVSGDKFAPAHGIK